MPTYSVWSADLGVHRSDARLIDADNRQKAAERLFVAIDSLGHDKKVVVHVNEINAINVYLEDGHIFCREPDNLSESPLMPPTTNWQPIETAPKDYTRVLLYRKDTVVISPIDVIVDIPSPPSPLAIAGHEE